MRSPATASTAPDTLTLSPAVLTPSDCPACTSAVVDTPSTALPT